MFFVILLQFLGQPNLLFGNQRLQPSCRHNQKERPSKFASDLSLSLSGAELSQSLNYCIFIETHSEPLRSHNSQARCHPTWFHITRESSFSEDNLVCDRSSIHRTTGSSHVSTRRRSLLRSSVTSRERVALGLVDQDLQNSDGSTCTKQWLNVVVVVTATKT